MIEVDVFWGFAIGASFAAFAGRSLQKEKFWDVNKHFIFTLIYQTLIFAPAGVYLLWAFPGWESMFYFTSRDDLHAILPTLFAFTNVFLGCAGFFMAYDHVKRGDHIAAHGLWVRAYTIMFGILGFGYRRFLYAGTGADWAAGKQFSLVDFFDSEVFYTLLAMGVVVIPFLVYPQLKWFYQAGYNYEDQVSIWTGVLPVWISSVALGVIGYLVFILGYHQEEERTYYVDKDLPDFGYYAPLLGFVVAQLALLFVVSFLLLVPNPRKVKAD